VGLERDQLVVATTAELRGQVFIDGEQMFGGNVFA
jgi:hypothetical protein